MLVPHFIQTHYEKLSRSYISILEIGGSHAYRIKPLIDSLGLTTLVITDIDVASMDGKKAVPEKGKDYSTNNEWLKDNLQKEITELDKKLAKARDLNGKTALENKAKRNLKEKQIG